MSMETFISLLTADLTRDEGIRSRPYRDSLGKLTIGIGHNLDAEGLCDEAIHVQLGYDLQKKVLDPLDAHLGWWRSTPLNVQRVLANMCFNLGYTGLSKFVKMLDSIRKGEYTLASQHLLNSKYARQVGARADRLALLLKESE